MPIKWKALPVKEAMDKAEEQVNLADQFLSEARRIVEEASKGDNLPEYMTQPMSNLKYDLENLVGRCRQRLDRIREHCPEDALVSERKKLEYGAQETLSME